ncbi:MAG: metal ABC transporter ATP-binding protein [Sphaerobacteraceae bacterium]|nr:MAG: metal ABC transporter ATP-binding protein [Sphaerobacteraceae bacterium]
MLSEQRSNLPAGPAAIQVEDLSTGYQDDPVLEHVQLSVAPGSLVGLIGPNGSGKSTLFKTMTGLQPPWQGRVLINGQPGRPGPEVAYVPQTETVDWSFPVTVGQVVMMGRYPRLGFLRWPRKPDHKIVDHALEMVGMGGFKSRQIGQLSGGQRQRVFLARALAQEPSILLLDEPVSGVDATTQHQIFELLDHLCKDGVTTIVASHDLSCVAQRFDQVLLLNRTVHGFGPPEDVLTQDLLNRTFQSHLLLLRLGNRTFVVEDPDHFHHD